MSTNVTMAGQGVSPGSIAIAFIRPMVGSLMIAHTFLILLVPFVCALFYYSTPYMRCRPIFILNVLALVLAFSVGVIADVMGIYALLSASHHEQLLLSLLIVTGGIGISLSVLVDLILLMRLVVVYPLSQVGTRGFILVIFLPVFLKVFRVINAIVFLNFMISVSNNPTNTTHPFIAYYTSPYVKIEWAAQIVDNGYASFMFLRTIHGRGAGEYVSNDVNVQSTLSYRLRALFRIALSNFVIPTLFSIALLVIAFCDVNGIYVSDIAYVNGMISAYGVTFASVWVGVEGRRKMDERKHALNSEHGNMNTLTSGTSRARARNLATSPTFSVGVMGAMVGSSREGPYGAKQGYSDLDASHEIALVPIDKGKVGIHLSSPIQDHVVV